MCSGLATSLWDRLMGTDVDYQRYLLALRSGAQDATKTAGTDAINTAANTSKTPGTAKAAKRVKFAANGSNGDAATSREYYEDE